MRARAYDDVGEGSERQRGARVRHRPEDVRAGRLAGARRRLVEAQRLRERQRDAQLLLRHTGQLSAQRVEPERNVLHE